MEKEWFKDWFNSPYYHKLYFDRDETEAAGFIDNLFDYLHPAAKSKMLDVACGKGRHALHMANNGYDVTGIDLSEDSIKEASKYENANLQFFRQDMRLLFWINYFDYVFNLFTSFGYFKNTRENDDAIRTMAVAMKPGATLVIDYLNTAHAVAKTIPRQEKIIDSTRFLISKWNDDTHFHKKIEVHDDILRTPLIFTEKVSKFSLNDFENMFSHHGLKIKEVFGDYHLGAYDEKHSARMVIVAEK